MKRLSMEIEKEKYGVPGLPGAPRGQPVPNPRGQQLPGRLLGLPAHVQGAAQEHGRQGPVVLPAAEGQGALGMAGRGSLQPASRPSHTAEARAPAREQGHLARGGG